MGNKHDKCVTAGVTGGLVSAGGVALMAVGGPIGMIAGSILLSGGISGVGNAIEQDNDNSNDDFSLARYTGHVVVNGAIGGLTAGAGSAIAGA